MNGANQVVQISDVLIIQWWVSRRVVSVAIW